MFRCATSTSIVAISIEVVVSMDAAKSRTNFSLVLSGFPLEFFSSI